MICWFTSALSIWRLRRRFMRKSARLIFLIYGAFLIITAFPDAKNAPILFAASLILMIDCTTLLTTVNININTLRDEVILFRAADSVVRANISVWMIHEVSFHSLLLTFHISPKRIVAFIFDFFRGKIRELELPQAVIQHRRLSVSLYFIPYVFTRLVYGLLTGCIAGLVDDFIFSRYNCLSLASILELYRHHGYIADAPPASLYISSKYRDFSFKSPRAYRPGVLSSARWVRR